MDRFDHLEEPRDLPQDLKEAVSKITRFDHLEIGAFKVTCSGTIDLPPTDDRIVCNHCGQYNEKERDVCWACFKPMKPKATQAPAQAESAEQEITLVLDGTTYVSSDPRLPNDIRVLIDRIRKEGYSKQLLVDWQNWRATRNVQLPSGRPFNRDSSPPSDVQAFHGSRVSVIRIDGKVYTSDDKDLSPEMQQLFGYLEQNGVTQALMNHLRQYGNRVKFRPHTTGVPSDGDISFWNHVRAETGFSSGPIEDLASPQNSMGNIELPGFVQKILNFFFGSRA